MEITTQSLDQDITPSITSLSRYYPFPPGGAVAPAAHLRISPIGSDMPAFDIPQTPVVSFSPILFATVPLPPCSPPLARCEVPARGVGRHNQTLRLRLN